MSHSPYKILLQQLFYFFQRILLSTLGSSSHLQAFSLSVFTSSSVSPLEIAQVFQDAQQIPSFSLKLSSMQQILILEID